MRAPAAGLLNLAPERCELFRPRRGAGPGRWARRRRGLVFFRGIAGRFRAPDPESGQGEADCQCRAVGNGARCSADIFASYDPWLMER